MIIPLQITFRQMETSPALEARIRELASRLDKFSGHIQRCHVIVEPLPGHSQQGGLYEFRIDMALPDREIAVRRASPADPSHQDPYVALRDAFRAARRRLQDYERRKRGDVKAHTSAVEGRGV